MEIEAPRALEAMYHSIRAPEDPRPTIPSTRAPKATISIRNLEKAPKQGEPSCSIPGHVPHLGHVPRVLCDLVYDGVKLLLDGMQKGFGGMWTLKVQ